MRYGCVTLDRVGGVHELSVDVDPANVVAIRVWLVCALAARAF